MTLQYHARITADGRQAQAAIRETKGAVDGLSGGLDRVQSEGRAAGASLDALATDATQARAALNATAAAARGVNQTHVLAAGSVGNLTAQFNDVGVMMAAGQNPLQLALQQGTQITQVLGPMGAGQAVRALGTAFMSLLSPINLVTIGGIAAGAALVQWLTRSSEEAGGLVEAIGAVEEKLANLQRSNAVMLSGAGSEERFDLLRAIEAQEKVVASAQDAMRRVQGARDLVQRGVQNNLRDAEAELASLKEMLVALDEAVALNSDLEAVQDRVTDSLRDGLSALIETSVARQAAQDEALGLLDTLREENALREVALSHGENSIEYANARADAERRAFEEMLETLDVSEQLKDELRLAFEEGLALSQVDVASSIRAGATEAERLANALGIALSTALELANATPQMQDEDAVMGQAVLQNAAGRAGQRAAVDNFRRLTTARTRRAGRSGSGARAARAERDEVAELIARYKDELSILRETDPVQKEMLRNRDALKNASAAERAEIEELILLRQSETRAVEDAKDKYDLLSDTLLDVVPDLTKGGDAAAQAWERLGDTLQRVAWEAILLGEGPLASLMWGNSGGGSSGIGGLAGALFGAIFPGAAARLPGRKDGGMIFGDGGSRDDRQLVLMSPGEMAINAAATARHRGLLEAINAGAPLPGLANGGSLGGSSTMGWGSTTLIVEPPAGVPLGARMQEERQPDGQRLQRLVLSEAVANGMAARDGQAQRFLSDGYGLTRRGALR
ncbi:phage tail length tape measure family protein [uncultured Tateyamaria sp.]|uniref:phage tail length tape measure family protein n=1 Tax=uncultured Tateyamaria sp. TaxID=455651 RepID=UPI002620E122|nr:phage tail length tape measure family protein [uncultured Tateyamaria sp.]